MKILHIGMEMMPGISRELSKLGGYRFLDWTYFMELGHAGQDLLKKEILKVSEQMNPDITFIHVQRSGVINGEIARLLKGFIINYTYDVALPIPYWYYDVGYNINLTIFCDESGVRDFNSNGIESEFLHVGYDELMFSNQGSKGDYGDIVFLGNNYDTSQKFELTNTRIQMVDLLKNKYGNKFKVYGNKWKYDDGNFMYQEHKESECYRSCKIAINISHFDLERYTSDRVFRIMGSGAFCLSKWYPGIEKDFTDGVHLRVWKDFDELQKLIDYYLINEDERIAIASAGHKLAIETATWEMRMKTLINMANVRMSKEYKSRVVKVAQNFRIKEPVREVQEPLQTLSQDPSEYTPMEIPSSVIASDVSPINEYFDNVYCINLDRRPDRWKLASEEFIKNNLTVERISAVDGNSLGKIRHLNQWEHGCFLSHISILKTMVQKNYQRILILEDDIQFIPDVQEYFKNNINDVPNIWSMLYFGGNHINPPKQLNKTIAKTTRTYTTGAYAVNKSFAEAVLKKLEKGIHVQIDVMYADFHRGANCFTYSPKIAWQRPGYSDIQQGQQDYTKIIS